MGSLGGYLGQLLGYFGVTLGIWWWLWFTFASFWGHFGHMMRICGGLEGPKSGNAEIRFVFNVFMGSTDGAEHDRDLPSEGGGHFAYLWVILRLLWASEACFKVIMLHFQKTFIYQKNLMIL